MDKITHWYAIRFSFCRPGFKSRWGRGMIKQIISFWTFFEVWLYGCVRWENRCGDSIKDGKWFTWWQLPMLKNSHRSIIKPWIMLQKAMTWIPLITEISNQSMHPHYFYGVFNSVLIKWQPILILTGLNNVFFSEL